MTEKRDGISTLSVSINLKDKGWCYYTASSAAGTKNGLVIVSDGKTISFAKSEIIEYEISKKGKRMISYLGGLLVGMSSARAIAPWIMGGIFALGAKSKLATIGLSIAAIIACVGVEWTICDIVSEHVDDTVDVFVEAYYLWRRSRKAKKAEKASEEDLVNNDISA